MSNWLVRMVVFVLAWVVALTVGSTAGAQEKRKLNYLIAWPPSGWDSPFFLAIEHGHFADEGLEMTYSVVMGSGAAFPLLGQGSEVIGNPDFGFMTKAVEKGMPLKAIFGIQKKSSLIIVSRQENPIRTPKDLEGRMIAMAPWENSAMIFPALLAANNVDPKKINVVSPAVGAKLGLFLNGNVDAITSQIVVHVPVIESKGIKIHVMSYADFGANVMNNGIVVNTKWLEKNEDAARGFVRAFAKAWKVAMADPNAAIDAFLKHYPDQKDQKEILLAQLRLTFPLLETVHTKGRPVGWMAKEDWEETQEIMFKYGGLGKKVPVETYYTNKYIPE